MAVNKPSEETPRLGQERPSGAQVPSGAASGGVEPSGATEGAGPTEGDYREMLGKFGERLEEQNQTLRHLQSMIDRDRDRTEQRLKQQPTSPQYPTQPSAMDYAVHQVAQSIIAQYPAMPYQQALMQAQQVVRPEQYSAQLMQQQMSEMAARTQMQETQAYIERRCKALGVSADDDRLDVSTAEAFEQSLSGIALEKQKAELAGQHKAELDAIRQEIAQMKTDRQREREETGVLDVLGQGVAPQTKKQDQLWAEYQAEFDELKGMGNAGQRLLGPLRAKYRERGLDI